ncbi:3-oxoacyl-ACP reductase FabG [Weissella halotolerans]|uniref:3-oxoacyl-[acyl-carrier-protein] reductase n=1 Tax=Weissella halotolerans DSM 20190 TaxID=1123500 RepID=A0A0R2FZB4_9LACO|nr:3-oxoacyl-ACP reductase FabG [Weissella halotolerans]KRN33262.1 3-oxoacyl-[acyl-carrier-protein] reductase [Weissella halotolerans DSM 20190]
MELAGKTVLVTGSTRGIGLAIAQAFSAAGARLIVHGRHAPKPALLATFPTDTTVLVGDIADDKVIAPAIKQLYESGQKIDILVNNAGIIHDKLAMGMKPIEFAQVVDTNLNGTFNVTQPIFKKMLRQRSGAIINMASVVGQMGNMGQANYAASKAGIIGLTKSLAKEGALRGIRVNAIAPGMIDSDMTAQLSAKVKEQALATIPLARFGQASEIAQTALFLAENDYITGQTITVDGGLYI